MQFHDRRQFLKNLATGVVYSAPVMVSLAVPPALVAQGMMPSMMNMGMGGMGGMPDPVFDPPPPGRG